MLRMHLLASPLLCGILQDGWMKLATLSVMFQKLMGLVRGEVEPDNQDGREAHRRV